MNFKLKTAYVKQLAYRFTDAICGIQYQLLENFYCDICLKLKPM